MTTTRTTRYLLFVAMFAVFFWTITATQISLEDGQEKGRDSKVKVKKALKEAAMLLGVVKNLGQVVVQIVSPLLQLKSVSISAFTALITFFWFSYELLKTKEPTQVSVQLRPGVKHHHEVERHPSPSVAILPVVTSSHEVHTYDYDDYDNVYSYKQHFGGNRVNLNYPNYHVRR